jgi:hypothetical protein
VRFVLPFNGANQKRVPRRPLEQLAGTTVTLYFNHARGKRKRKTVETGFII